MKKITRRSFLAAMAAVSAAGVLTACGGSGNAASSAAASESASVSSEAVSSAASADETGTHTVIDHGGNEVEVPNKVTRVVIDQIPILSTYMAYFEGSAPYIVGYCGSFKSVISDTVLKNIAPELMESSDTVYAQSDLNIEEIMKLNPDVILYNAGNSSYNKIVVFIDRSPAECYNSFRVLWIGEALLPQRRFLGGSNHSFFVEMLIS